MHIMPPWSLGTSRWFGVSWDPRPGRIIMLQLCSEEANACFATDDTETTNALVRMCWREIFLLGRSLGHTKSISYNCRHPKGLTNRPILYTSVVGSSDCVLLPAKQLQKWLHWKNISRREEYLKNLTADELVALHDPSWAGDCLNWLFRQRIRPSRQCSRWWCFCWSEHR